MGAHEVGLERLLLRRGECHGVVEKSDHVREGVAEETGDADGHVNTGPTELLQGHGLQTDHSA